MFFLLWVKYGFIGLKLLQSYLTYNSIRKDYLEELTITETDACVGEDEDLTGGDREEVSSMNTSLKWKMTKI